MTSSSCVVTGGRAVKNFMIGLIIVILLAAFIMPDGPRP
jgi:hypothetical protein